MLDQSDHCFFLLHISLALLRNISVNINTFGSQMQK